MYRLRLAAPLLACLAGAGCVSADLAAIAPQPGYAAGAPAVATDDAVDADGAATDFARSADKPAAIVAYAAPPAPAMVPDRPARTPGASVDALIAKYAAHYGLSEAFVRRVVKRESNFRPHAHNRGHWGLMQIKHQTARTMGYRGPAEGLLDAETNLIYAVKYLRGAWLVARGDEIRADLLYQRGYYYDAKAAGLLEATGLGKDRARKRRRGA